MTPWPLVVGFVRSPLVPDAGAIAELLERLMAEVRELRARLDQPQQRYFGVDAAAAYSDLSAETIRRLLAGGKLTPLRPCKGRVLIDKQQLDSLILSSTTRPRTGRGRHP